jgi:hypothetical protein
MEDRDDGLIISIQQSLAKVEDSERWLERINPILRRLIEEAPTKSARGEHTKWKVNVEFSKSSAA